MYTAQYKQTFRNILIVAISFLAYYLLFINFGTFKTTLDSYTKQGLVSYIITYILIGIPILLGTYFINSGRSVFSSLGLTGNIITGMGLGLLFTSPMFIGGFIYFTWSGDIEIQNLIAGTIVAGFMEELYFRGFLFGQLFRNTRLGFIPSILFGAIVFALGHLYQSHNLNEMIGVFMITFLGAVFFAWLYVEWGYNLWVSIFLHTFMNLSWHLFETAETALGDVKANVFRALTITLTIVFTVIFKKRRNEKLLINKQTLFYKKEHLTGTVSI